MSAQEYRQRVAELCDAELRQMIYEEIEDYLPEAIEAARAELDLRNRDIFELGDGDTVTLKEVIDRLDFDECIAELKRLNKKAETTFYNELLVRHLQTAPAQDGGVLINFVKSKTGAIEVFSSSMDGGDRLNIENFHYNEWLAAHIKKAYLLTNGREFVVALCLLKMTNKDFRAGKLNKGTNVCQNCGNVCDPSVQFCGNCSYQQLQDNHVSQQSGYYQQPLRLLVMQFCPNCGTKLMDDYGFCPNCGTRVQDAYLEGPVEMPQNLTGGPTQATGGLKVWLWLMIVGGLIGVIASIAYGIYFLKIAETFRDQSALLSNLGSQYSRIATMLFVSVPINIVCIFGEFRLLKGYKHGFYIICICVVISFIITILAGSVLAAFVGLTSPVIVWLFAREQWKYFQ
ncbi:zinc ribbon domain-containing protein [Desulfosporosinus metallidurans]|uniref:Zinc-ribbon domain-containing protein n=1 Tax=Desulfosporosinus metallidurans TaxID=1888891 RepID=A0A1Q8QWM1_9FIRM|nr:zinc ribbon domain-containing protein [Desulfosporosinus metallidurans]OLN31744.1 hypothetical protein DSOL_2432 [Desulfosporosinus metallidurans]